MKNSFCNVLVSQSESRILLSWHICEARLGPCYFFICLSHISARQCTLKFLIYDTWSTQFSESQVCRFEQPTFSCIFTLLGVKDFMQYVWFPAALCVWWSLRNDSLLFLMPVINCTQGGVSCERALTLWISQRFWWCHVMSERFPRHCSWMSCWM